MNIVLIGIQGSGKGELIKNLNKHFNFTLVSVGALFRQEMAKNSALGKRVTKVIESGHMVDVKTTVEVVENTIKNAKGNLLFDGFPRGLEQFEEFKKICKIDKAIYLKLNKNIAKQRLLNRLTCTSCQFVTNKTEAKTNICPVCGGKLNKRKDDNEQAINTRLSEFDQLILPVVEKYKQLGVLVEIDASKSKEDVFNSVMQVLK